MNDTYVECMVKRDTNPLLKILYMICMGLAVICLVLGVSGAWLLLAVAAVSGILAFFLYSVTDVEYEYLYLDREVTVDKVMHKSRRKKVCVYSMEKMLAFAPVHSYHLDEYKNMKLKVSDYSIGREEQPDRRYAMIMEGQERVILSPTPEFVNAIKTIAPRKVFTD